MLTDTAKVLHIFPYLKILSKREWKDAEASIKIFPAKTCFFDAQVSEKQSMFLLRGIAHISSIDEKGREIISNTLSAGEVCGLLALSGLSGRDYPGTIISTTEVEILFIRKTAFLKWILHYESIRRTIFGDLLTGMIRMGERRQKQEEEPVEKRLLKMLLNLATVHHDVIPMTHYELAKEIGTVREVVSRYLLLYKQRGWIKTGRGEVKLLQREQLELLLSN